MWIGNDKKKKEKKKKEDEGKDDIKVEGSGEIKM